MGFRIIHTLLPYFIMYSWAFEDFIYVYGDGNKEMAEQGRAQYQMIKARGALPKYGPCWKTALQHLNEACRYLSEDTQSDVALSITNCFLEMSGHETYNCELDKKPNLRGICINSMSDRAFNVYTEFYTHTQNICWFLRGQIWHETIAENTLNVGKQLELSASLAAEFHRDVIKAQKESVELQDRMVEQGKFLEKVLEDVYVSTKAHQDILKVLTQSVTSLQTWIVGEVSWIDSILFNIFALFVILIITSSQRTLPARLPLFFLLFLNMIIERLICSFYTKYSQEFETHNLYSNLYSFVWYSRYGFMFFGAIVVLYIGLTHQDIFEKNLVILNKISLQNADILKSVEKFGLGSKTPSINFVAEDKKNSTSCTRGKITYSQLDNSSDYATDASEYQSNFARAKLFESQNKKYQLRSYSRQGTPDSGVVH